MPAAETTVARQKQRIATRKTLNSTNRSQTNEVKKKLQTLREALEREIKTTRDPGTAERLREIVDQVVASLERLEAQDEKVQRLESDLIDFDRRAAVGDVPLGRRHEWRPGHGA